ncbi:transcription antitermination protein NusB [Mycoplasmopsis gallopavonis]|uniref:Transcription termination factor n=1 Tax=Mycoplasmopsis gallopavonis TaxID=76629 RepID=A0A449AZX5_9BACT|nr:transcription antitermination protein NusB [Mycoplasmopsis gallopavonis]RIV16904.1 transcription antitermination protein NusB [Mycoplasmopsis gallopavonis]VEU73016.1 transcription termination factor [Mycoplasmopsis gallopavonis]
MAEKNRRTKRVEVIQVIYKYELLEEKIDVKQAFEEFDYLDNEQLLMLEKVHKNYKFLKNTLLKLINPSWKWHRISPIVRAILLNGACELFFLQPKIVINEAIEITKMYFLKPESKEQASANFYDDWQYKFVNGVLENYYKLLLKLEVITQEAQNN